MAGTGFVESTVKDIDLRVRELETELEALKAARAALLGAADGRSSVERRPRRRPGRPRRGSAPAAPRRTRGRAGGTRADQALALVRARPGITIPEIAEAMSIEPNYLYRVLPKLAGQGQVAREGQGWRAAENSAN